MSKIAAGSLHKYLTGEVVTGDDTQVATNLNIVFETIRLALNDADSRVDNVYTKAQIDALNYTKAQVDAIQAALVAALNTHKSSADHDGRYYTETEIDGKITVLNNADTANTNALTTHKSSADHDGRYYTETEIDGKITTLNTADSTNANNLTNHKASGDHDSRYFTKSEISSTDLGESGASIIGVTPIATSPDDLQGMVEWLKNQIDSAVTGTIPDASIMRIKLHPEVTTQLIPFGVTTGTANNYAITLSPAPSAYTDGMPISFKIHSDSSAASTINVNGLGAKNIVKASGAAVTNLKNNGVYTVRYNQSTGNFILQGEGGGGNAISGDIRSGKTATTDAGDVTGTMPTVTQSFNPSTSIQTIPAGYHAGTGIINPVVGNTGTAQVLSGYQFSSGTGMDQIGGMPNRGAMTIAASSVAQTIPGGWHNGSGIVPAVTFDPFALLQGNTVAGTAGQMPNRSAENTHQPAQEISIGVYTPGNTNQRIYLRPPGGWYNGSTWVAIDQPNLVPENVKKGVPIGAPNGFIGTGPEFGVGNTIPSVSLVPNNAVVWNGATASQPAYSQCAAGGGAVYYRSQAENYIYKYNSSGGLVWSQAYTSGKGMTITPDGLYLYYGEGTNLVKLRTSDKVVMWTIPLTGGYSVGGPDTTTQPILLDSAGNIYVLASNSFIQKYNSSGGWIWTYTNGWQMNSFAMTADEASIYYCIGTSSNSVGANLYRVNTATGAAQAFVGGSMNFSLGTGSGYTYAIAASDRYILLAFYTGSTTLYRIDLSNTSSTILSSTNQSLFRMLRYYPTLQKFIGLSGNGVQVYAPDCTLTQTYSPGPYGADSVAVDLSTRDLYTHRHNDTGTAHHVSKHTMGYTIV